MIDHNHEHSLSKTKRQELKGHKSLVIWLTGLSGAGKSTIAKYLEEKLFSQHVHTFLLDGDVVRNRLNQDLGFSAEDRHENIRRIAECARLFTDAGLVTITATISPYKQDRELARSLFDQGDFIEVYVKCSLEECEKRDPKGLYPKARSGEIEEFTGISQPYEEPEEPEIIVDTTEQSVDESVNQILHYIEQNLF
ncbi:adenylyl-sulfate kinase [Alkalibacillus aidingensis]|uniref:adenylyl-sulfate kinase n=1 Tax=Alkalibacillus aidingensis TaxID=2747607 RepID=UPI0016615684|nr:adenylyl-sulfate kinase [Alkalibacillus aidingensis]